MGTLDFRSDKLVLPLQAADLVAWTARRQLIHVADSTARELQIGPHPKTIINIFGDIELQAIHDQGMRQRLGN